MSDVSLLSRNIITLLDKCKSLHSLKQLHALFFTFNLSQHDPFLSKFFSFTALSHPAHIDYSCKILLHLQNPSIFNWNTVIRGYSNSKNPNKSISLFVKMLRLGLSPDYLTYPFVIKASARLLKRELAVAIHAHTAKTGYESDRFIANSLIHLYASCGDIIYARKLFDGMPFKNLVSWNSMLDGYAKCGEMNLARQVFDLMPEKDVVSWSSLIDGYVKSGDYKEAMTIFEEMRGVGPKANEVTMVSVLCACAHLGALDQGRMMHQYMVDNGLPLNLVLQTSLVDMYAKCGAIKEALSVFRGVKLDRSDVLMWNAMIGGLAVHGLVKESLELFKEMQIVGITPDEITFLCLLSACAHGGLVTEAWYFFDCLGKYGMTPKSEHYACVVDVLSRAGRVAEAYNFVCQMPMKPTASMLGALLTGCMNHGKLDLAEIVGKKLIELEPDHDGRYIGLSNVYAISKRWDDARTMREAMELRGVKKYPGCSFVEMFGTLHRFIAHDKTHPSSEKIYMMLNFIAGQMKLNVDHEIREHFIYDMTGIV
ncbi:pentatricopeptide repeat-containing protein At5g08305-like [Pistacia vera]|uniref:pentatricopeptide repeat-containing protein At5g08305-like n=1 Tax=Pistacia vera TaxID=55513 RepID=UPI001262C43F|nr:pentatricopeptide repeat-containing protein At5g08305-like [Pistacia vera]